MKTYETMINAIAAFLKDKDLEFLDGDIEMVANEDHIFERLADMIHDDNFRADIAKAIRK